MDKARYQWDTDDIEIIDDKLLKKGGPGSGWHAPPEGTHTAGARAGNKKIGNIDTDELKRELVLARRKVLMGTHSVDDVVSGKAPVGVEGRGGKDTEQARRLGLFTMTVNSIPIFAQSEAKAKPLIDYLRGGGRYGTPEFSGLLGYSKEEIENYKRFLTIQDELTRQGVGKSDITDDELLKKGGPGSGWYGPPRGTHTAGAKARGKVKTAKQMRAELLRDYKRKKARIAELSDKGVQLFHERQAINNRIVELNSALFRADEDEAEDIQVELKQAQSKEKALYDKLYKISSEENKVRESIRLGAAEKLKVDTPADFDVSVGKVHKGREECEEGARVFASLMGRGTLDGLTVTMRTEKGHRGSYDKDGVYLPPSNRKRSVVVHELGHWLEDKDPDVHAKAVEFLERRTRGEKEIPLSDATPGIIGYKSWEVTKKDKFLDPYMGKQYRRTPDETPYATEIVSMGVEYMYAKPLDLAEKDPEYFDFMYDLMRGR